VGDQKRKIVPIRSIVTAIRLTIELYIADRMNL